MSKLMDLFEKQFISVVKETVKDLNVEFVYFEPSYGLVFLLKDNDIVYKKTIDLEPIVMSAYEDEVLVPYLSTIVKKAGLIINNNKVLEEINNDNLPVIDNEYADAEYLGLDVEEFEEIEITSFTDWMMNLEEYDSLCEELDSVFTSNS